MVRKWEGIRNEYVQRWRKDKVVYKRLTNRLAVAKAAYMEALGMARNASKQFFADPTMESEGNLELAMEDLSLRLHGVRVAQVKIARCMLREEHARNAASILTPEDANG